MPKAPGKGWPRPMGGRTEVRLGAGLRDVVKALAVRQGWPINRYVVALVRDGVERALLASGAPVTARPGAALYRGGVRIGTAAGGERVLLLGPATGDRWLADVVDLGDPEGVRVRDVEIAAEDCAPLARVGPPRAGEDAAGM